MEHDEWKWQEPGTPWKGVGLYHVTLTIPSREPLLGSLVIPEKDPTKAHVNILPLGRALLEYQRMVSVLYPEIQILHYCLMPDHLHAIWYVRQTMPRSINKATRGFLQGAKKAGRAYTYLSSISPASDAGENAKKEELTKAFADDLRKQIGGDVYDHLHPVFTEKPFIRPMGRRRQLPATVRYLDMNPQRLATKILKPGYFRVQDGIEIDGRMYSGVGNVALLQEARYMPVHVRWTMVDEAAHGYPQRLRDYMNGCVKEARGGTVMVSPFVSADEKRVLEVLLAEKRPFIYLADNGFRDYYKPADGLFDAVAEGRALILSPWVYDASKKQIRREECVALNGMAEEICEALI